MSAATWETMPQRHQYGLDSSPIYSVSVTEEPRYGGRFAGESKTGIPQGTLRF